MTNHYPNMVRLVGLKDVKAFNRVRHILSRTGQVNEEGVITQTVYIVYYREAVYLAHYKQVEHLCSYNGENVPKMTKEDFDELYTVARRLANWNIITLRSPNIMKGLKRNPTNVTVGIDDQRFRKSKIRWRKLQWLQM